MKCVLFADTIMLKKDKEYYSMTLTYEFLSRRYLKIIDKLVVTTRKKNMSEEKGNHSGYKIANGKNIEVRPLDNYFKIPDIITKNKKIEKEIISVLNECDKAIIRLPNVIGLKACELCKKMNIPYIIEMLACPWDGYSNHTNKTGKLIAPFMYYFNKKAIKNAKEVIYVTNEFLQRRYPTNGNGYSCSDVELKQERISPIEKKAKQYKSIKIKEMKLCTVANIEMKYKGHIYVLKAIKKIKKLGYNPQYYIVGNGDSKRIKKLIRKYKIEKNVILVGSLNHEQVFDMLDEIDVYVQPSLQEGLPRALVEAMSRGCLCIGSTAGGIPELLEKKYIFKKKKYKELVDILKELNKEDFLKSSKRNYEESQKYNNEILNKKRNEIYTKFLLD